MWSRPICLLNARVVTDDGFASSIRFSSHVLSLDGLPGARDILLDAGGAFVLPGLLNAHDHLELNHYGAIKFRDRYDNAAAWIDDMRPRLRDDARLVRGQRHSLSDRLFIGGLKNLLSGVTTVAHHNPFYPQLRRRFPVRVLRRYGWAHSFLLQDGPVGANGERGGDVRLRYRSTPRDRPFFIHLAEGLDAGARSEAGRLDRLGCLSANTVLIHGVGLCSDDRRVAAARGAALVWCPASNHFLLGRSADVHTFAASSPDAALRICLGTDSRLTGSRDHLDEMKTAAALGCDASAVFRMVTANAARVLRTPTAGRIAEGLPADLVIIPAGAADPARALLALTRNQIDLVTIDGRPMVASPQLGGIFAGYRTRPQPARIDGATRLFDRWLARRITRCAIEETGVEILQSR